MNNLLGIGSAFGDKSRLRDIADLALLAYISAGRTPTRLPPSRAPVCVPATLGRVGPKPPAPDTPLIHP